MIKYVIFDIGNVLVRYDWEKYLASYDFSPEKQTRLANALFLSDTWKELDRGVLPHEEIVQRFVAGAPEYEQELRSVYKQSGNAILREDFAIPWILDLKNRGYGIYYLSNYSERARWLTEDALDFVPLMDGGIFSYQVRQIKPDHDIYETFLKKYPEVTPEEAVFLDDTKANVEAARELGFAGIWVRDHQQAAEELEQLLQNKDFGGMK